MYKPLIYNGVMYLNFLINKSGNVLNLSTNHIYKNTKDHSGYLMVYLPLGKRGKTKAIRVHKAVAETFLPNPNKFPIVHHKDENKENPNIINLEWVTSKENANYHVEKLIENNKTNSVRKLKKKDVKFIRKSSLSRKELSKMFGVSKTTISNVKNGKYYGNIT